MIVWHPGKNEVEEECAKVMVIAVSQDCERILIGQLDGILGKLEGKDGAKVDYDTEQPFGTLLVNSNCDESGSWSEAVGYLEQAQEIFLSPIAEQLLARPVKSIEKDALRILKERYETGDPISCFVATRIWHEYWKIRGKRKKELSEAFLSWAKNIVRPFGIPCSAEPGKERINSESLVFRRTPDMCHEDRTRIVYSSIDGYDECLILRDSLVPLEHFYMNKMDKWTKYIVPCKVCGKFFMADSLQYELCSDACKKAAQRSARERRKEDASTMEVDKILATAYAHWNNRLRKIRKSPEWSAEEVRQYQTAMKRFRAEKNRRSMLYKKGNIPFKELQDWLTQQQEEAEQVLQDMKRKKG